MAGPTVFKLKANSTIGAFPSGGSLQTAEPALNTGDAKLYSKLANGSVVQIAQPVLGASVSFIQGVVYTSSNTDPQILDSWAGGTYRSAEYVLQVTDNTNSDYQVERITLLHDGTSAWNSEYGVVFSNQSLLTVASNVNSGTVRLWVTPTTANSTFKLTRILTVV